MPLQDPFIVADVLQQNFELAYLQIVAKILHIINKKIFLKNSIYKRESMQIPAWGQMKRFLKNMEEIICTFFSMAHCICSCQKAVKFVAA